MLRLGARPPSRSAPMKAKTNRRRAAPEMAKKRSPAKDSSVEKPATTFKLIKAQSDSEAEDLTERYLNRYTDRAVEVWIWGKRKSGAKFELAYHAYGLDHPLNEHGRKIAAARRGSRQ